MNTSPMVVAGADAVGILRVSRQGKRADDRFISPEDQLKIITELCGREGLNLAMVYREIDQSGYRTRFEKRRGLYPATRMVENGEAKVVVFAFFDRMARNIVVQTEFLGRVGRAGGRVLSADFGEIQTDSAVATLSTGMLGLVAQFMAQSTAEKTQGPKERAIGLGIPTFPHIPAGYRRGKDRTLEVFEPEARLIREVFERRARGESYHTIRDWLRTQGLVRSTRGVQEILKNRIYLGELRFGRAKAKGGSGELVNLYAHPAIVDRARFDEINDKRKMRVRGPRGAAESIHTRLLSRQAILCCAKCGRAMIVGTTRSHGRQYVMYRCPTIGDCTARAAIMADNLDTYVGEYMERVRAQGTYSANEHLVAARAELASAREDYKQVMRNLATSKDADAKAVIDEYRVIVEQKQQRVDQLQRAFGPSAVRSMADWGTLSLAGRRDLVRAVIRRITVRPGRVAVAERVTIEPFLE